MPCHGSVAGIAFWTIFVRCRARAEAGDTIIFLRAAWTVGGNHWRRASSWTDTLRMGVVGSALAMPVDISNILHVLAHELRTPVGIAQGYVRLLLDDRLPQEADRRRALEQMQKALGRLGELSHESTALAGWFEREGGAEQYLDARTIVQHLTGADYVSPVEVDGSGVDDHARVRTVDAVALVNALVTMVRATARELRHETCAVVARTGPDRRLELLAGAPEQLTALRSGPTGDGAGALALERGGLGLALVHADAVLEAHGAERWTVNGSRQTVGIRLRLEERPHP